MSRIVPTVAGTVFFDNNILYKSNKLLLQD